jgi:hypothetical protein
MFASSSEPSSVRRSSFPPVATAIVLAACALGPELASPDWASLGLADEEITAVAATPWGLYAGTRSSGVFRYDEAEDAWHSAGLADAGAIHDMLFVPAALPRLLVGVGPDSSELADALVYASEDGATWAASDGDDAGALGRGHAAQALAHDPAQPDLVYLSISAWIFRSQDGGRTWQRVFGDTASNGDVSSISASVDGAIWGVALVTQPFAQFHGLVHSKDQGSHWLVVRSRGRPHDIHAAPDGRVWMARDDGVRFYSERDETWDGVLSSTTVEHPVGAGVTVLGDGDTVYAVTRIEGSGEVGVFRVLPGRARWDVIRVPLDVTDALCATVDEHGRLLIGTAGAGVWRMEW